MLTQAKMYSLRGPHKGRGIVQVTSTLCQLQAHSHTHQTNPSILQMQYNEHTQLPRTAVEPTYY